MIFIFDPMKWIGYLFSSLWRLWFLIVFILVFIAFMPLLFFFTAIIQNHIIVAHLTRYWSKATLILSFLFPRVEWEEKIDKNKNYIFCPNHVSTLDIPLILAILPVPLQYIGKAEIAKLPLFGYFYKNNSVIVNRKNKIFEVSDRKPLLQELRSQGVDLPYGCEYGGCITCAAKLIDGEIDQRSQIALNNRQINNGYVVLCVARPKTNCEIEIGVESHDKLYRNPFLDPLAPHELEDDIATKKEVKKNEP